LKFSKKIIDFPKEFFFFGVEIKIILKYSNFQHGILKNNSLFNRACVVVVVVGALLPVYYSSYWVFRAPNIDKRVRKA
jgi:hypothetical protein